MIQKLTKSEVDVLEHFFQHPTRDVHIRGLADTMDLPYSSVRNALHELESQGFLTRREESKMTFFAANRENDTFQQQKRIYNLQALYDSGAVAALEQAYRPDALVLFGSYLQGTDRETSDIDIAIVNGRDAEIDLDEYEDELERTFQLVEVADVREEEPEFRNTLANGYVLSGHLTVI